MWTRFDHIDQVPTGLPLMYLTLLAREYLDLPRLRPHGSTVLDMMREPDRWITNELYTQIAECAHLQVEQQDSNTVVTGSQGAHRVTVVYPNRNVAISRCIVLLMLAPLQLTVPTELVISYEQWKNDLSFQVGQRAGLSGKTMASTVALSRPRGILDAMLGEAETDVHAPEEYVERLRAERANWDVILVGAGPSYRDVASLVVARPQVVVDRPRTRIGVIGAGAMVHAALLAALTEDDGYEIINIDSVPDGFSKMSRLRPLDSQRYAGRSVFDMDLAPILQERQFGGDPYLGTGGGDTARYYKKGHAQRTKAKRLASKRARKQTRRNK